MNGLRLFLSRNVGALLALALFLALYCFYSGLHPKGFTVDLFVQNSNKSLTLMLVGMAQTLPVLLGGIDLSVGSLMTLVNSVASEVVRGSPPQIALGIALCLGAGLLGGLVNGLVVVLGRLQPIVVTLATGAIYSGIALFIRPTPGGEVDGNLGWVATNALSELPATFGWWNGSPPGWFNLIAGIPMPIVILVVVVVVFWLPYRNSEPAAPPGRRLERKRGLYVRRARQSRQARRLCHGRAVLRPRRPIFCRPDRQRQRRPDPGGYLTLNSIAAVVIGGTSMLGGSGGAIGTIFGAAVLRAITFCFRVVNANSVVGFLANPLLQPMFEGVILLIAVSAGAAKIFRMKNRLDMYR